MKTKKRYTFLINLLLIVKIVNGWEVKTVCKSEIINGEKTCSTNTHRNLCDASFCTTDLQSCDIFIKLIRLFKMDQLYMKRMAYEKLIKSIEPCNKPNKAAYVWNPSSICMKANFCHFVYPKNNRPLLAHLAFKQSACRCRGLYHHECTKTICSKDVNSCEKIPKKYTKSFNFEAKSDVKQC